jgi:hypothetical protein
MSFQPDQVGQGRLKDMCTEASGGTTGWRSGRVTREEMVDLMDAQGCKLSAPEGAAALLRQVPVVRTVQAPGAAGIQAKVGLSIVW